MTKRPTKVKIKGQIPDFKTIQEEAEFWDTHDFTDYQDGFKPVEWQLADDFKSAYPNGAKEVLASGAKKSTTGITIRFPVEVLAELRRRATQKGIGASTLARMWIMEGLGELESQTTMN